MTSDGIGLSLAFVRSAWPHSNLGEMDEAIVQWRDGLAFANDNEVAGALRRLRDSGREHAPSVGVVVRTVKAQRQGPPPSIEDGIKLFLRKTSGRLPYSPSGSFSQTDTANAIAVAAEGGVHEAILRFVAERGLREVLWMPDGSMHPLDPNQLADRRDMVRHYRDTTLVGWRANPEPGLALDIARTAAGLGAAPANGLVRPDFLRHLPSGDAA